MLITAFAVCNGEKYVLEIVIKIISIITNLPREINPKTQIEH